MGGPGKLREMVDLLSLELETWNQSSQMARDKDFSGVRVMRPKLKGPKFP